VFFPNGGVASVTTVMKDGTMVEIATVGVEGVVGINALFGAAYRLRTLLSMVTDDARSCAARRLPPQS
jgi:hypothetical protein